MPEVYSARRGLSVLQVAHSRSTRQAQGTYFRFGGATRLRAEACKVGDAHERTNERTTERTNECVSVAPRKAGWAAVLAR